MIAGIDILNCGDGHTEIRFDGDDAIELERAKKIISDMLRRGYVIFVHGPDDTLIRVDRFDPEKCCYLIDELVEEPVTENVAAVPGKPKRRYKKKELPVETTHVTAIARSAGG